MISHRRIPLACALVAAVCLLAPATSSAGVPGKWTKVTSSVPNITELGLSRTADKKLHVLWVREDGGLVDSVQHSVLSANAKTITGPHQVISWPGGGNNNVALVTMPDGSLRGFFAGLFESEANPLQQILASSTSSDGGNTWSPAQPVSNNTPGGKSTVYGSIGLSAAVQKDGTPVSVWASPGAGYHVGLSPATPDGRYQTGCCVYKSGVGVDAVTGATVIAWQFLESTNGTAWQSIAPLGPRKVPSGSKEAENSARTAISGRIGAPGVYLAYQRGTFLNGIYPAVLNTGSGKLIKFSREKGAKTIGLAPAPGGRMWIFWYANTGGKLQVVAARSNTKMTRFGPIIRLKPPKNTVSIYRVAGEASVGPLDLFALAGGASPANYEWHQRIMPRLTIKCTGKRAKATCKVTDAGDAVKNARVKIGSRSKKTNSRGQATVRAPRGSRKATATKTGYKGASVRVRVR